MFADLLTSPGFWTLVVLFVASLIIYIKVNLKVCHPNEIMVFSGRSYTLEDGSTVGYRVIRGGRALKVPIVESVARMSLSTITIDLNMDGVLAKGMIPVSIRAVANVKVDSRNEQTLDNAIERFLGKSEQEISETAREIIEGNLRGVLATMPPEKANDDRLELARRVEEQSREDLEQLGLVIDTLNIEDLSDDRGYLEAIGRQKNAEITRDAENAESRADAEAKKVAAEARKEAEVAEHRAQEAIVEAENEFRVKKASLESEANREEAKAELAGEIARLEEATKRDEVKVEQKKKETEAEVVVPARAEKEAAQLRAKGESATLLESGKARAEAVNEMRKEWEEGNTKDLFLIQLLPDIVDDLSGTVKDNLDIDRVSIVGNGTNGDGLPSHVRGVTGSVVSMMEELKNATGLDIPEILSGDGHDEAEELIKNELE